LRRLCSACFQVQSKPQPLLRVATTAKRRRYLRRPEAAELTMIIRWCMGVMGSNVIDKL
jgi:hypothetical protein